MRTRTIPLSLAALVALAGCAGPRASFQVGTQSAPLALTLGANAAVQSAPVGPISTPIPPALAPFLPAAPSQPAVQATDTPSAAPVVSPPAMVIPNLGPCPAFNPLAPVLSDGRDLPGPPQAATYSYRAATTDQDGSTKQTFKGNSTWKVSVAPVSGTAGAYDVTTAVSIAKVTTTRIFRVLTQPLESSLSDPSQTDLNAQVIDLYNGLAASEGLPTLPRAAPNVGIYGPAGVYLVEQKTADSDFMPTVPIPLVQTPIGNNSFTGVGSDGTTNMIFKSTVKTTKVLNACGTKVATTEVQLTNGTISSLAGGSVSTVNFTETLDFGLLYGGLPLHDQGTVSSGLLSTGGTVSRSFDYTVNSVPKRAK